MNLMGGNAAQRQAEKSRELQRVANDRQAAELRLQEQRDGASRRSPRGRRLFTSSPEDKTNLS